jgi:hypothetical protein
MNSKRIGARLFAATVTVGAMMSVATPAWAATEDPQSEMSDNALGGSQDLQQQVEDAVCEAAEANREGVTAMDIEFIGGSSCPESGLLP